MSFHEALKQHFSVYLGAIDKLSPENRAELDALRKDEKYRAAFAIHGIDEHKGESPAFPMRLRKYLPNFYDDSFDRPVIEAWDGDLSAAGAPWFPSWIDGGFTLSIEPYYDHWIVMARGELTHHVVSFAESPECLAKRAEDELLIQEFRAKERAIMESAWCKP
jgi:hypothetical protein